MKKYMSQVIVALVCCILGFMLAYQFKIIRERENSSVNQQASADITVEISELKKEKQSMQGQIDDLQSKIKKYESVAASNDSSSKQLLSDLQESRIVDGSVDVKGPGVSITIPPQKSIFGGSTTTAEMTPEVLVKLVNFLNAYEAEAISINNIRITSRTGIVQAGSLFKINNDRISPDQTIIINVIGNKDKFLSVLNFPGSPILDFQNIKITPSDNLTIPKYNGSFKMDYAKLNESK